MSPAHDRRPSAGFCGAWAVVALVAISCSLLAVLGRVAQLQLAPEPPLRAYIAARVGSAQVPGLRGDLLDRRGRLLAVSRLGARAFVDPVEFDRLDVDDRAVVLETLAGILEVSPAHIGSTIRAQVDENRRRQAAIDRGEESRSPSRFLVLSDILPDSKTDRLSRANLPAVHLERRLVREYVGGPIASSLVGLTGFEETGLGGAEYALDGDLQPSAGSMRFVRDAAGRPLWVEDDAWRAGSDGAAVRLSIDLQLQRIAAEELWRGIEDANAVAGRLVMIDPDTGEILAMLDMVRTVEGLAEYPWWDADSTTGPELPESRPGAPRYDTLAPDPGRAIHPSLARNRCVEDVYEPGSTFKPFVWATVTERGLARSAEVFDTEGGRWFTSYGRYIEDVTKRDRMTWDEVLINSSNIGMTKGAARLGYTQLRDAVLRYGFGRPTGVDLPGEASGLVTQERDWNHYTQTSVSFGYEVAVTPVQMVRAFSAFARSGELAGTLCNLSLRAVDPGDPQLRVATRVVDPAVTERVRYILEHVSLKMEDLMRQKDPSETGWKYRIFGKSGTANIPLGRSPEGKKRPKGSRGYYEGQYNSNFIAAGPLDNPRLITLVVIDDPGPERVFHRPFGTHYGSHVAGPVVRRVLERSLGYLGVPESDPSLDYPVERLDQAVGASARGSGRDG